MLYAQLPPRWQIFLPYSQLPLRMMDLKDLGF